MTRLCTVLGTFPSGGDVIISITGEKFPVYQPWNWVRRNEPQFWELCKCISHPGLWIIIRRIPLDHENWLAINQV